MNAIKNLIVAARTCPSTLAGTRNRRSRTLFTGCF